MIDCVKYSITVVRLCSHDIYTFISLRSILSANFRRFKIKFHRALWALDSFSALPYMVQKQCVFCPVRQSRILLCVHQGIFATGLPYFVASTCDGPTPKFSSKVWNIKKMSLVDFPPYIIKEQDPGRMFPSGQTTLVASRLCRRLTYKIAVLKNQV